MTDTAGKVAYKAFGLRVTSSITFPELPRMRESEDKDDVIIEKADLSKLWSELAFPGDNSVVQKDIFMFQIPNLATFCIKKGTKIIVSPMKGADNDHIRLFVLGTCMGALLMQRRVLPLHGSAVAINQKAYCIIGESGAGKSTVASALLSRGYKLLSDDVIAVSLAKDNTPMVMPAFPQQKLWQESLNELGMKSQHYCPIFIRENKYAVPVPGNFSAKPLPLAGVFELVKTDNKLSEIHRIQGLERLPTLFRHTYRKSLISRFQLVEWHFSVTANIASRIDIFQLSRPTSGFTAHHLASLILNTLNKEK